MASPSDSTPSEGLALDAVNGESFGFDTIRLKENNTRIKFDDTSVGSFPANDWQLTANDSASGGANKFSIEDVTGAKVPFTITAGAPSNSIFVDSSGRLGLKTSSPVVDIHTVSGNTPTLRLEQNGSSGFTPQTWDVAGNEVNFFVRDVTGGSRLPFRIRPGAPTSSIDIAASGNVGIGTGSPGAPLEVATSASFTNLRLTANGASPNKNVDITYTSAGGNNQLRYNIVDGDAQEMSLDANGNLVIAGQITTAGSCSGGCDLVFDKDYKMMPLERHAEAMWTEGYLPNVGPTAENGSFNLSTKVGGMLNELEYAHVYIDELNKRVKALEEAARNAN